jgi:hypothetical protein
MTRIANWASAADVAAFKGQPKSRAQLATEARDGMNKTEANYADQLQRMQAAGAIVSFAFEAKALELALRTTLTPDFMVTLPSGAVEFHEVKGRRLGKVPKSAKRQRAELPLMREDAWLKLKLAADRYRAHRFIVVWPARDGSWHRRVVEVTATTEVGR